MDAWERGDVDAVVALLAEDATLTMPPMATWFRGDGVVVFLTEWAFSGRAYNAEGNRRVRVAAGARERAAGDRHVCLGRGGGELTCPTVLQVLTFDGTRISEITGFVDPSVFPRFGLPDGCATQPRQRRAYAIRERAVRVQPRADGLEALPARGSARPASRRSGSGACPSAGARRRSP